MTVKQLKEKLDASAAELAKNPEDAALKTAHQEAKSAYDAALAAAQNDDDADDEDEDKEKEGKLDVSKLDPKAQKLIKDLRKENADSRTRAKALADSQSKLKKSLVEAGLIENDEEDPADKLKNVTATNEALSFNSAVLEHAVEHGVGKSDLKYFKYLIQEAVTELKDGEELDEDAIAAIAKSAKRSQSNGGSTSVNGGGEGGTPPSPGGSKDATIDQFIKMNMGEKTALYLKHPDTYTKLMAEAKSKNLLV